MEKREFIKIAGLAGVAMLSNPAGILAGGRKKQPLEALQAPFTVPALPYATNALEPHIDQLTMEIHHDKHHGAYVKNLNDALALPANSAFASLSLEQLLAKVTAKDAALRNNAGGHYNHSFFWTQLTPHKTTPSDAFKAAISKTFGSWEKFQDQFNDAAKKVFGSGWAWLTVNKNKELEISSTPNQDNHLMEGLGYKPATPILGLDVWEHAYYLKHQNRRPEYVDAFWNVINWPEVEKRWKA
ncbi:MAG TPA: superoxide dismutase [Chitinophaga sp.]